MNAPVTITRTRATDLSDVLAALRFWLAAGSTKAHADLSQNLHIHGHYHHGRFDTADPLEDFTNRVEVNYRHLTNHLDHDPPPP